MGCQMLVATEDESRQAEQQLNEVPGWFADWEQRLSRFRPESELNKLNQRAGMAVQVSPIVWKVMQAALNAWLASDGLVNPAVLPALERSGYVKSFQQIGEVISIKEHDSVPIPQTFSDIKFDESKCTVFLPEGMRIDFGGVAKGWAAHQAMQRLSDLGPVLVDAGGDVAISKPLSGNSPWVIGVNNPFNRGAHIEKINLREGGVATSGRDHRRWQQGGEWQHHIIDPHSGKPAETDLLSVTVVAKTVMEAEMAAKVVFILGSEVGLDWLDRREGATGLAVLENGELLGSHGIEDYLRN